MMQKMMDKKNKKGFTLIELIVVIAIIAILAAIAIPRLTGFREKAQIKADIASARTILGAAQIAIADGVAASGGSTLAATSLTSYLNSWPKAQYAGTLTLVLSSGSFSVTDGLSSPTEILPNPGGKYVP